MVYNMKSTVTGGLVKQKALEDSIPESERMT